MFSHCHSVSHFHPVCLSSCLEEIDDSVQSHGSCPCRLLGWVCVKGADSIAHLSSSQGLGGWQPWHMKGPEGHCWSTCALTQLSASPCLSPTQPCAPLVPPCAGLRLQAAPALTGPCHPQTEQPKVLSAVEERMDELGASIAQSRRTVALIKVRAPTPALLCTTL